MFYGGLISITPPAENGMVKAEEILCFAKNINSNFHLWARNLPIYFSSRRKGPVGSRSRATGFEAIRELYAGSPFAREPDPTGLVPTPVFFFGILI
jgi:hypothetical protein